MHITDIDTIANHYMDQINNIKCMNLIPLCEIDKNNHKDKSYPRLLLEYIFEQYFIENNESTLRKYIPLLSDEGLLFCAYNYIYKIRKDFFKFEIDVLTSTTFYRKDVDYNICRLAIDSYVIRKEYAFNNNIKTDLLNRPTENNIFDIFLITKRFKDKEYCIYLFENGQIDNIEHTKRECSILFNVTIEDIEKIERNINRINHPYRRRYKSSRYDYIQHNTLIL